MAALRHTPTTMSEPTPRSAQSSRGVRPWVQRCAALLVVTGGVFATAACTIGEVDPSQTTNATSTEAGSEDGGPDSTTGGNVGQPDRTADQALYRDMNDREVDMENADYAGHTPEEIQQISDYGPDGPRLSIPGAGLDVPLGTMNSHNGVIEPVGFSQAYIVGDFSPGFHDPESGSLMLVAHALDGEGKAPGNFVWDSATSDAKVSAGDEITAHGRTYVIDGVEQIGKSEIVNDEDLWSQRPGTLFFVTCVPNSDENLVISAHLA